MFNQRRDGSEGNKLQTLPVLRGSQCSSQTNVLGEGRVTGVAAARQLAVPAARFLSLAAAGVVAAMLVTLLGPIAVVAAIAAPLAVYAVVRAPGIVLAAYLLVPFYKAAIQPYSPVDVTVLLALANAMQAAPLLVDGHRAGRSTLRIAVWLAFGVVVLAGVLYAPDQSLALSRALSYWALVILPILPAAVRVGSDPRYVRHFLWACLGMGLLIVVLGIAQFPGTSRLVVLDLNTIQVARAAMLVPLIGIAFVLPQRRPAATLVIVVAIPAALVVAVASGSRGPLLAALAVVAGAGCIHVIRERASRGRRLLAGAGLAVLSLAVLAAALPSLPELSITRFESLAEFLQGGASSETSAFARVQLYQVASGLWAASPFVGSGTGGFETIAPRLLGIAADSYPHNFVLQLGADHGVVGVAVVGVMIAIAFRRPLHGDPIAFAVQLAAAYFILNAMVSGDFLTDRATLGLLLILLMIGASGEARREDVAARLPALPSPTQLTRIGVGEGDGVPRHHRSTGA
jgi:O-antigen ligase